jgi:hypothetical protein
MLFAPGNATELADCVETLLNNPRLALEYGRRGRERCEKELTDKPNGIVWVLCVASDCASSLPLCDERV